MRRVQAFREDSLAESTSKSYVSAVKSALVDLLRLEGEAWRLLFPLQSARQIELLFAALHDAMKLNHQVGPTGLVRWSRPAKLRAALNYMQEVELGHESLDPLYNSRQLSRFWSGPPDVLGTGGPPSPTEWVSSSSPLRRRRSGASLSALQE